MGVTSSGMILRFCAPVGMTSIGIQTRFGRRDRIYRRRDWLFERGVKAVVYDCSEEYVVRNPGFRGEDCVVYHKILENSIFNIEYVVNLAKIECPRCATIMLPLNLVGLSGLPSRVIALDGVDLPKEFELNRDNSCWYFTSTYCLCALKCSML
jgi:hypothetical protein